MWSNTETINTKEMPIGSHSRFFFLLRLLLALFFSRLFLLKLALKCRFLIPTLTWLVIWSQIFDIFVKKLIKSKIHKICVFVIAISFFDEIKNFRDRTTNQKRELVVSNCQWNCIIVKVYDLHNHNVHAKRCGGI